MKKSLMFILVLCICLATNSSAEPTHCDCYGGWNPDTSPTWWYLTDYYGYVLEDGDYVYAAWTGPDGCMHWPALTGPNLGGPTGDDSLLVEEQIWYGSFYIVVTVHEDVHPMEGDLIYCRIFDDAKGNLSWDTYYSCSQLYELRHVEGEVFCCLFPGDPGGGHTHAPLNDF